ncbi:MAG: SDR family NAD(P)-dependent oxidoreductase [Alcanivoracaceae bacterium]|nr:SDR family NAD(P)-dependent oxidoreductase [Alcanivoracaceae bacterium]
MNVTLITGAASGLGWALARGAYARGDHVVLVDMNADLLFQREQELSGSARVASLTGDITDESFQSVIFTAIKERFGRLDTLINNAGITHRSLVQNTDPKVLIKVMAVDWQAPVQLACAALPFLEASRGTIINVGSMAGWMPVMGRAAYCSAKSALAQFFEVLRCEVAGKGIKILNVYPSFLDTPIEKNALGGDGAPASHQRSTVGKTRSAEWMAAKILLAQKKGKRWIFPDPLSLFGSILWRVWPSRYLAIMSKRFAVELQQ